MLRPGTTLVLGEDLAAEALAVAERVAGEQRCSDRACGLRSASRRGRCRAAGRYRAAERAPITLAAPGAFQRRNFALARTAAEAYLRAAGIEPRERCGARGGRSDSRARPLAGRRGGPADGARRRAQSRRDASARRRPCRRAVRRTVRWVWCSACSRTRTPRACSRRCSACASAPGSPPPRAAVPCRPRRCSRWRASSASTQWFVSPSLARAGRGTALGAGARRERGGARDRLGLSRRRSAGPAVQRR